MQLYAVNFIPLLNSLYMFRAAHTPIIRSTTVSTATGTIIGWRTPTYDCTYELHLLVISIEYYDARNNEYKIHIFLIMHSFGVSFNTLPRSFIPCKYAF